MNERIKKLIDQMDSNQFPYQEGECSMTVTDRNLEYFAELIVRECANQCDLLLDHKISSEWSRGTHDCAKAIKKHFGVE